MHDPCTQAFRIDNFFIRKDKLGYRPPLLTIWHHDPEKDGTDDSCGWFIRSRHIDKEMLIKVQSEFEFNFKHNYWFNEGGYPKFSVIGLTLEMYSKAAWVMFMYLNNDKPDRKRHRAFMKKHLYDIIHFAENPTDSLFGDITLQWGVVKQEERIRNFVSIISADIMRKERKWYQHPRWHIHHWELQFHPLQNLKRRFWDKCCKCGKRGFKEAPYSDWYGTRRWHQHCDDTHKYVDQNLRDTV